MKRYTKTISAVLALALLAAVSESPARAAGKSPADTVNVPAKAGHRVRQTLVLMVIIITSPCPLAVLPSSTRRTSTSTLPRISGTP